MKPVTLKYITEHKINNESTGVYLTGSCKF